VVQCVCTPVYTLKCPVLNCKDNEPSMLTRAGLSAATPGCAGRSPCCGIGHCTCHPAGLAGLPDHLQLTSKNTSHSKHQHAHCSSQEHPQLGRCVGPAQSDSPQAGLQEVCMAQLDCSVPSLDLQNKQAAHTAPTVCKLILALSLNSGGCQPSSV
jgi:hypothetical protein